MDREELLEDQSSMSRDEFKEVIENTEIKQDTRFIDRFFYTHTDVFLGAGFGDNNYSEVLFGARPSFFYAGSKLRIAPELSVGYGEDMSFNALANGYYHLTNYANIRPYIGGGVGVISPNGEVTPAVNMAIGSNFKHILDGNLTAEFATRNILKYNQISIGYELF